MGEKKRRMHVKHVFMRPRMLRRDGYRVKIESFTGITIYRVGAMVVYCLKSMRDINLMPAYLF